MSFHKLNKKIRSLLIPFSILYGIVIRLRHKLFDWNILPSASFKLPVICIGNITIGGTGKTPHVEYLINLLKKDLEIAVLSRGYKRRTKGYLLADKNDSPESIGDESFQIFKKHKEITVAVCEKRVEGISQLINENPELNAIILDDAFQHRYVKPGLNILLIDFNRPVFSDKLLPAGNLRDTRKQMKRAEIVIVTKTPPETTAIEKRLWIKELNLFPYQQLFFSTIEYGELIPIFPSSEREKIITHKFNAGDSKLFLITGIANPEPFIDHLHKYGKVVETFRFPDHHTFTKRDIHLISKEFDKNEGNRLIITTEKDAVRIEYLKDVPEVIKNNIYYLPIKIKLMDGKEKVFDKSILNYVRKNKRIGQLH